ncbi:hypothetical protein BN7_6459 [Wickerhamomyces ciferrii]|uniref:Uncharacterized protein n=1 Tax=Wickerhamomyces ciferrii (strain ATCC 14091 / BCRC 22168 / CBS 111 / JCM 3599 / NBRC 0793 / NRRL Y-1031 F-60-10) TaxID=1206466 RepID=K0KXT3_WICCF|nr:uncharacterized protein BN7_6459 [Wickerhamomyces ciferrii]CCH46857.1 hypothetical protein BN7_6459 [Wickerhamomyces ciferrii]
MFFKKSGYRININVKSYENPKIFGRLRREPNNLLIAKTPKNFKIKHKTFKDFNKDKSKKKLVQSFKEFPNPIRELSLNYKLIEIKWERDFYKYKVYGPERYIEYSTCRCLFFSTPGYNNLQYSLIELFSNLTENFQRGIPAFLNTECFGNGLDMIEDHKVLMKIIHEEKNSQIPLKIIFESLLTYILSEEYESLILNDNLYDHKVKAYEFNYQNQLKIMTIWGEKLTSRNEKVMLEQLNYMISNDVLSEPPKNSTMTLIPGYLNYNVSKRNDKLPPSYGLSIMKG